MPVVDGFDLPPPETWIVAPSRIADVGKQLLAVSVAGLGLYDEAERFERRMFTFGRVPPLEQSIARQIVVTSTKVHVGRAGEEQFTFNKHNVGAQMFQTALYEVTVGGPFPKRQGQQAVRTTDVDEFATDLCRQGLIVWNTLMAVVLGGIRVDGLAADDVGVGPMVPKDPQGGQTAWVIGVAVQL